MQIRAREGDGAGLARESVPVAASESGRLAGL
jgi:hypothetical protein